MPDQTADPAEPTLSLVQLAETSGFSRRTVRFYQGEGLLPKPVRRGRDAVYGGEHVERLRLIGELRDRGLTLGVIKDLLARPRPVRTVAEWLDVDETLRGPWSDDRPELVERADLLARLAGRGAGLLADLMRARYVQPADGTAYLVPSPTLLDLALRLHAAGVDIELSGRSRDLLRRRLGKAADEVVALFAERAGSGFAGRASKKELARAIDALRPIAKETAGVILAQEVERALRGLLEEGPRAVGRRPRR